MHLADLPGLAIVLYLLFQAVCPKRASNKRDKDDGAQGGPEPLPPKELHRYGRTEQRTAEEMQREYLKWKRHPKTEMNVVKRFVCGQKREQQSVLSTSSSS